MKAYTLAEVLTTLTIIGFIAVVTMPVLNKTVGSSVLEKQQKVFKTKLEEGLHRMQIHGELAKEYSSTEDFVNTMRKYFSFTNVCSNDKLSSCFGEKIRSDKNHVLYNLNNVRTSAQLGLGFSVPSNLVGLIFSDGTRAVIAYDTNCVVSDVWNQTANVSACFAMYGDIDGEKGASVVGEDVIAINTNLDKDRDLGFEVGKIFKPSKYMTEEECEAAIAEGAPTFSCNKVADEDNYWAQAVYECWEKEPKGSWRLPNCVELGKIASKIYGTEIKGCSNASNLEIYDSKLWSSAGFAQKPNCYLFNKERARNSVRFGLSATNIAWFSEKNACAICIKEN